MEEKIITGNYFDKYQTGNPIYRKLMSNFMTNLLGLIKSQPFEHYNILETGCGEGHLANIILDEFQNKITYQGFDIEDDIVELAQKNAPNANIKKGSIYELQAYQNIDLQFTITSEVLEHLEEPEQAIKSLLTLNSEYYLLSVPNEPIWRVLNMARLKYLKDFGNTPGHIQHWSKSAFKKMLSKHFEIIDFRGVFPWSMALCRKK